MVLHVLPVLDHKNLLLVLALPPPISPTDSLEGYVMNNRFVFCTKIGAGTFGLIYLVQDLVTGTSYAAKIILANYTNPQKIRGVDAKALIQEKIHRYFACHRPLQAKELNLESVQKEGAKIPAIREIALHLTVHKHPNIATIHHVLLLGEAVVITLMDYFPQGDLFGNIIDRQIFLCPPSHQNKQLLMKNCMLQLVDAVAYCSSKNVFHCDLKPENVMVSYNPHYRRSHSNKSVIDYGEIQIFLIDFGLAMNSDLICCNVCRGSSFYMAPERIVNYTTSGIVKSILDMNEFQTDEKSTLELASKLFPTLAGDIWSLGVLFVNITCSKNPWPVANINDRHEVFHNYILNDTSVLRSILPILRQFNGLLNEIFTLNPNTRIPLQKLAHGIIACDFFNDAVQCNAQLCTPPTDFVALDSLLVSSIPGMYEYQTNPTDYGYKHYK